MREQGWISQEEMEEALADDVYARISEKGQDQGQGSAYSYFIDELISQVQEDLVEKKGYTQTQAANAVFTAEVFGYTAPRTPGSRRSWRKNLKRKTIIRIMSGLIWTGR